MDAPNLNQLWADLIIAELVRNGVSRAVVAPGSRSAPLAVAAARNKRMEVLVHFDERGAAFAALGCSKTGKAAAVICTSGTALANCFPAVAEARLSATPLFILSADRPPELQECGANQTMFQQSFFGDYAECAITLSCPVISMKPETVLAAVDNAVAAAGARGSGGPVHVNCMYREPLAPDVEAFPRAEDYMKDIKEWEAGSLPYTHAENRPELFSEEQLTQVHDLLQKSRSGLTLIGGLATPGEQDAALQLAQYLRWPVFADITSGCREKLADDIMISMYDVLLHSEKFRARCVPDTIVHIGDVFVSKRLQEHLSGIRPVYIQLTPRKDKRDPMHCVTHRFQVDVAAACGQIMRPGSAPPSSRLLDICAPINREVCKTLARITTDGAAFTELTVAATVNECCSRGTALFVGNSMPVRDLDMTTDRCKASVVCANRGVSGIDGNIATAAGVAWGTGGRTLALMGDMATLHDLNSLPLLERVGAPVVLVIVNNHGGGIFSFLPIARHHDVFEPYFINPHDWRFDKAAAMFGLDYQPVRDHEQLKDTLDNAFASGGSALIEAFVARDENVRAHAAMLKSVTETVDKCLGM
ncbi:MAG TPA: 2-succinyl-5-enolpyruvyl-6-hydroxy-3-cyclohexene-1-carboxylic-acid synthase [Candidatus Hydrogenedentes bacterium]|nr:2-succinyl-5-enolpyruvyl-6-hydroxy-3-cyclohexene-1-carboxylic-acid synthase [Candidatus Hydrogenedentota bacterium]